MRGFWIFIFIILHGLCWGQQIETSAKDFRIDDLGQVFLIYDSKIELYSQKFERVGVYNPSFSDKIHSLDVSKSLRPLVFYKDQGKLEFLDNTLSEHNRPIDLYGLDFLRIDAVCSSVDNHLWIFDSSAMQLYRLNADLETVQNSGNLGNWLDGDAGFEFLIELKDLVYLYGDGGLVVFDLYANYIKRLSILPVDQVFMDGSWLYFAAEKNWKRWDFEGGVTLESWEDAPLGRVLRHQNTTYNLHGGFFEVKSFRRDK